MTTLSLSQKSPLECLVRLERECTEFGFVWPNLAMVLDQVASECQEIKESLDQGESRERLQEEIGDLVHATLSLCMTAGFDVEETLEKVAQKFGRRVTALKEVAQADGYDTLRGLPTEALLHLWRQAKVRTNTP